MASLFDYGEDARSRREALNGLDVSDAMIDAAGLLPVAAEPPKHWLEQARERDGNAKFFGKMLLGGMTGMMPFVFPEGIGGNARYKAELEQYSDAKAELEKQQRMMRDITALGDGVENDSDVIARTNLLSTDGLGSIEKVHYALTGDMPGVKPNMVTVTNNGQVFMVDKDNPTAPAIPVTTPDGQPIRNKLDQWQVDNIGAFDRMTPRLVELDEMENAGMAIPRSVMTQLRAFETEDSDGRNVLTALGWNEWLQSYLTPEQRKYILAAEDAGMVVLRDESGAAISASEILRQMNQYLMFDDLDGPTKKAQREARARKAGTLMTGMPDYILKDEKRAGQIEWLEGYDGTVAAESTVKPNMTTGNDKLPSMTQADMATYLKLADKDKKLAEMFLQLISEGGQ